MIGTKKEAMQKLRNLRRKYINYATGLAMGNLCRKLKAEHYRKKIRKHKIHMRIKGYL